MTFALFILFYVCFTKAIDLCMPRNFFFVARLYPDWNIMIINAAPFSGFIRFSFFVIIVFVMQIFPSIHIALDRYSFSSFALSITTTKDFKAQSIQDLVSHY